MYSIIKWWGWIESHIDSVDKAKKVVLEPLMHGILVCCGWPEFRHISSSKVLRPRQCSNRAHECDNDKITLEEDVLFLFLIDFAALPSYSIGPLYHLSLDWHMCILVNMQYTAIILIILTLNHINVLSSLLFSLV